MRIFIPRFVFLLFITGFCSAQAATVPFLQTGDLFVIESKSGILRITPEKDISIFLSIEQIESVIGVGNSGLSDNGVAFDQTGNMYFADNDHILKYTEATGILSILASEASIAAAQGITTSDSDVDAITIGEAGNLYVTDDRADSVLRIDSNSGAVSTLASNADFLAQTGIEANLEQGIVTGLNGDIYVASQGGTSADVEPEDAIFQITSGGVINVLTSNNLIADPDQFMTTDVNGNLIVASDEGQTERIFHVNVTNGTVSELISTAMLEGLLSDGNPDVDVRGGLAYDDLGNLFIGDSDEDLIMMFDTSLNGSVFVSKADIMAATGESSANLGAGFAFAPAPADVPAPETLVLLGLGLLMLMRSYQKRTKSIALHF